MCTIKVVCIKSNCYRKVIVIEFSRSIEMAPTKTLIGLAGLTAGAVYYDKNVEPIFSKHWKEPVGVKQEEPQGKGKEEKSKREQIREILAQGRDEAKDKSRELGDKTANNVDAYKERLNEARNNSQNFVYKIGDKYIDAINSLGAKVSGEEDKKLVAQQQEKARHDASWSGWLENKKNATESDLEDKESSLINWYSDRKEDTEKKLRERKELWRNWGNEKEDQFKKEWDNKGKLWLPWSRTQGNEKPEQDHSNDESDVKQSFQDWKNRLERDFDKSKFETAGKLGNATNVQDDKLKQTSSWFSQNSSEKSDEGKSKENEKRFGIWGSLWGNLDKKEEREHPAQQHNSWWWPFETNKGNDTKSEELRNENSSWWSLFGFQQGEEKKEAPEQQSSGWLGLWGSNKKDDKSAESSDQLNQGKKHWFAWESNKKDQEEGNKSNSTRSRLTLDLVNKSVVESADSVRSSFEEGKEKASRNLESAKKTVDDLLNDAESLVQKRFGSKEPSPEEKEAVHKDKLTDARNNVGDAVSDLKSYGVDVVDKLDEKYIQPLRSKDEKK